VYQREFVKYFPNPLIQTHKRNSNTTTNFPKQNTLLGSSSLDNVARKAQEQSKDITS
jgi:hypothetical protein